MSTFKILSVPKRGVTVRFPSTKLQRTNPATPRLPLNTLYPVWMAVPENQGVRFFRTRPGTWTPAIRELTTAGKAGGSCPRKKFWNTIRSYLVFKKMRFYFSLNTRKKRKEILLRSWIRQMSFLTTLFRHCDKARKGNK